MATDLITLAEYKAYTGITNPNQDTAIKSIISKASTLAKSTCRRTFVDYVNDANIEIFDSGSDKYYLTEFPVIEIAGVEYSTDYGNTYTTLTEFTDYIVNRRDGYIYFPSGLDITPMAAGYKVTYTGGYEEVPDDLKVAVMDIVTYYLKQDMAVKSQRDAGSNTVQIEYITKNTLPSHIARVLDMYLANAS